MVTRALGWLLMLMALAAHATELSVDKKTMQLDDTLTITLSLDGSFASLEAPRIPLQNLAIDGAPSESSEFQWINGVTSRQKVIRYSAHPLAAGTAQVGPLTLRDRSGGQLTLPAIPVVVMPDTMPLSNDPVRMMHELVATGRDPIFLLAQADKTSVYEREEVVVSWTLYAAVNVQDYSLGDIPKLADFWTEELDARNDRPERVMLGDIPAQKVTVRRAALFPLHAGTLTVGAMAVHAAVMKRAPFGDPFGLFEGVMNDVHRRSSPITIDARPLPPGPPVVAVGSLLNLACTPPSQKNGGPIVANVSLSGRANLRAAQPPAWQAAVDGTVQIVDDGLKTFRVSDDLWMTRRWRFLIFPAHTGAFKLPALATWYLTPAGERRALRCEATTLQVAAASPAPPPRSPARRLRSSSWFGPLIATAVLIALAFTIFPRIRRASRLRARVRALLHDTPAETRAAVETVLLERGIDPVALMREASDRGDAFRAFRSLIDAAEHDRILATPREIAHRIRDVLVAVESGDDRDRAADASPVHRG